MTLNTRSKIQHSYMQGYLLQTYKIKTTNKELGIIQNLWWYIATVYHENFKAEKFRSKLYTQTFVKELLRNPT